MVVRFPYLGDSLIDYSLYHQLLRAYAAGYCGISGMVPSRSSASAVAISSGYWRKAKVKTAYAGGTLTGVTVASAGKQRFDLIVMDGADSVIKRIAGTEDSPDPVAGTGFLDQKSPKPPNLTSDSLYVIACIKVDENGIVTTEHGTIEYATNGVADLRILDPAYDHGDLAGLSDDDHSGVYSKLVDSEIESTDGVSPTADFFITHDQSAGGNRKVSPNNAVKTQKRTLVLVCGIPSKTNGCVVDDVEMATNKNTYRAMQFADGSTILSAQWSFPMPDSYDGGTITAQFYWFANSTSTAAVKWGIQAVAISDDGSLDVAQGALVEVVDANKATANDLNESGVSGAMTIGGSPSGGKFINWRVQRDPTDDDDGLAADANLVAVKIEYGVDKWSD
jgi:hypothetical protein